MRNGNVFIWFRFCRVLDNLIITVQNSLDEMRSPLVGCLMLSNCLAECWRIWESLKKKERKQIKTFKTVEISN